MMVIQSNCDVAPAFDPDTVPKAQWPPHARFTAIWDTGATGSVIAQDVVNACGLVPTGMVQVNHAGGVAMQETYLVNIRLPQGVGFPGITVTKAPLTGTQMLIGMDIISRGDFAITNKDGITIFTFRVPSSARLDFVKEENRFAIGTQAPAPHRAGKKKR